MPRLDRRIASAVFHKCEIDKDFIRFDEWFKKFDLARQARAKKMWLRQDKKCFYCKREMSEDRKSEMAYTIDHVVSLSNGGTENPGNIVMCCHQCNSYKSSRSQEEFLKVVYDEESFYREYNRIKDRQRTIKEQKLENIRNGVLCVSQRKLCTVLWYMDQLGILNLESAIDHLDRYLESCKKGRAARRRAKKQLDLIP